MVAEISKLRADAQTQNHAISSLSHAQAEISRLQTDLKHQQSRFDDLQRAYSTLERSIGTGGAQTVGPAANHAQHRPTSVGVTWENEVVGSEHDRRYEERLEGGIGTLAPIRVSSKTVDEVGNMIADRTAQSDYYKDRAERAEQDIQILRAQLRELVDSEAFFKNK